MATPESRPARGLRIFDLAGLVVGYGMAALLARTFWPRTKPLVGIPAVFLGFEFLWLGLAMSGPIVLLLDRRDGGPPRGPRPRRPPRPGRLISATSTPGPPPVDRTPFADHARYTRAELAWMVIGGYWIALALFVVPARSIDTPWALTGLLQVVAALGLWLVVPKRAAAGGRAASWTNLAALGLLWTWPIAWALLILLTRSF